MENLPWKFYVGKNIKRHRYSMEFNVEYFTELPSNTTGLWSFQMFLLA